MKTLLSIVFIMSFSLVTPVQAQDQSAPSPIIFIYDASGSMWGQMQGKTKMEIAADVLGEAVDALPDNQMIGLVAYGHRTKGDCEDVEFLVNVESGTKAAVNKSVAAIKPLGKTPLAYSALQVINKLRATKMKSTIILITDGIESCGGNICDVIKAARAEGIDFKLHIIGFGLKDEDTEQLKCAAEAGNGKYYNAADAGGLGDVLNEATTTPIDHPDGNVSVFAIKNGKAIDAYIKAYDVADKIRPIAVRTYGDTAMMYFPPGRYNFNARPLGGSDVDNITIEGIESFEDKIIHQTISFDGGIVGITTTNNGENWDCVVKILSKDGKVIAAVRMYTGPKEVEVNPGIYDVSIQALGTMEGLNTMALVKDVSITSGGITPVAFEFETGHFDIFTKVGSEDVDCVVTIKEVLSGTSVAGSRTYNRGSKFLLNPGSYEAKVSPLGAHKDKATQVITFTITQGATVTRELKF